MAKKTVQCEAWLGVILNETLPKPKQIEPDKAILNKRPVNLVDSSCIKQVGSKGTIIRTHMCYSLTRRRMEEIAVTDHRTADSFQMFNIKPGEIYIADAGYGKGKYLEHIASFGADAILRVTPNQLSIAKDPEGKEKIDMAKELEALDVNKNSIDFRCFAHTEKGKYIPVRIIASRLPEDKIAKSIKRKKRRAQKSKSKIRPETLIYAQWVFLITSLDEESYSTEDVLKLYRLRWQVELLFKRIKQFFKITRIKAATVQHSKVLVLSWLIAWTLTERQTVAAELFLLNNNADMNRYSLWSMSGFFFHGLKSLIASLLSLCENIDIAAVFKRLRNHNSERYNQFANAVFP